MDFNLISHTFNKSTISTLKLRDHLEQTIKLTKYLTSLKSLNFSGITMQQVETISILVAACHDFGKSTSFFQDYIKKRAQNKKYKGGIKEKSHALVSAFFGYYFVEKWLSGEQLESHWRSFLPFAAFLAIEGHHSTYKSMDDILSSIEKIHLC